VGLAVVKDSGAVGKATELEMGGLFRIRHGRGIDSPQDNAGFVPGGLPGKERGHRLADVRHLDFLILQDAALQCGQGHGNDVVAVFHLDAGEAALHE
jgi:hypothetical protein